VKASLTRTREACHLLGHGAPGEERSGEGAAGRARRAPAIDAHLRRSHRGGTKLAEALQLESLRDELDPLADDGVDERPA
jgi:hypothetical protein